jgi:hypothetical protein
MNCIFYNILNKILLFILLASNFTLQIVHCTFEITTDLSMLLALLSVKPGAGGG